MNFLFRYHNVNVVWYRYICYMYMYLNILLFQFLIKNANDVHIAVVLLRVFYKMLIFFWNYRMGKQQQSLILIIHIGRWCMKSTRLDITIDTHSGLFPRLIISRNAWNRKVANIQQMFLLWKCNVSCRKDV